MSREHSTRGVKQNAEKSWGVVYTSAGRCLYMGLCFGTAGVGRLSGAGALPAPQYEQRSMHVLLAHTHVSLSAKSSCGIFNRQPR